MDNLPAPSFDPALLDMENMTADKWYALIYNRIVQQEDIFVGDIKKKVIEIINMCMNKPKSTLESVQQDITSAITESKFEFEHQNFIEGIVGGTYEYLCQFIIKSSMENIKRTQCALNCFSSTNNLNYGAIKSCNDNILLQGSSKMTQIQCLPESNNNTTDLDKAVQSNLLSNNPENNSNSMLMVEKENIKNTTINKMETTSFLNYRSTLQINNLSVEPANDILLFSNMDSAHSSAMIDDDEKTTEAILSITSKIEQTNFNFVDAFESDDINTSDVCTTNEIQTTKCLIEQNKDQHTDPSKQEEEYKMNNTLKLLESLVNIEHDKLEVQKSVTVNEMQPIIETNEKTRFKRSKKTNIRVKKSRKLQENIHEVEEEEEEEEWLPSSSKRNRSKNKTNTNTSLSRRRMREAFYNQKKAELLKSLHCESSSSSESSEFERGKSRKLALIGSLFSSYNKKAKTKVSPIKNTKSLDDPEYTFQPIPSTSNYNEKDVDNIKNKSSGFLSSVMKPSDYKKMYEKDRKSLFSPDVFITHMVSKSPKNTANELHTKKENLDKKATSKIQKDEVNNKTFDRERKLSKPKLKITDISPKMTQVFKSEQKSTQKSTYVKRSSKKYKKLRIIESDDEDETDAIYNPYYESNSSYLLENNEFGEGTSRQYMSEVNIFENKKSNTLKEEAMPEWLKKKCELYDIKPLYVVINPFTTY